MDCFIKPQTNIFLGKDAQVAGILKVVILLQNLLLSLYPNHKIFIRTDMIILRRIIRIVKKKLK